MRASLHRQPTPTCDESDGCFFVKPDGTCWAKETTTNPISKQTSLALRRLKIHRPGMSFYWLRHTFRTIADETRDFPAIDRVMGHADASMAGQYRERISDERLKAVTNTVHRWLFAEIELKRS